MPDGPLGAPTRGSPQTLAASDRTAWGPLGVCGGRGPYSGWEGQEGILEEVLFKSVWSEPEDTQRSFGPGNSLSKPRGPRAGVFLEMTWFPRLGVESGPAQRTRARGGREVAAVAVVGPGPGGNLPTPRIAVASGCSLGCHSRGLGNGGTSWRETGGSPVGTLALSGAVGRAGGVGSGAPVQSKPGFTSRSAQGPFKWAGVQVRQAASGRGQAPPLMAERTGWEQRGG